MPKTAIVIGAGIIGLATARALAVRGYGVTVLDRTSKAVGASIRNFGMIWPIGQPDGVLYETAMHSRSIWKEVCDEAGIWYEEAGSLHIANDPKEKVVLQELCELYQHRHYQWLSVAETVKRSKALVIENAQGSLYSAQEMIVDPREAVAALPMYLNGKHGIKFHWNKPVTQIQYPRVAAGTETFTADEVYVCNGADFETLYPQLFQTASVTKCKLQMLRLAAQPEGWRMGPALCGGLSLIHYNSFKVAPSLPALRKKYEEEYPDYLKWGIHVMACQNGRGEITVGDSHEYGLTHEPFDRHFINHLIVNYLRTFARFEKEQVIETWNGIYTKLMNGEASLVLQPEPGVTIINGVGGAGMTLSFGLCDKLVSRQQTI